MATFRIHNDFENTSNAQRGKNTIMAKNQKRTILGTVNSNAEPLTKNMQEKGLVKPAFTSKGLSHRVENVPNVCQVQQKPKSFFVFQDDAEGTGKVPAAKNANKGRILKERKEVAGKAATCLDVLPPAIAYQPQPPLPEPMSPDIMNESLTVMDVSMKSEGKPEVKAVSCREDAARELAYLNLTERLYLCDEYRDDISLYLQALQREHRPRKNYMVKQPDITYNMRAVLVDWLVEVAEEYTLTSETLYLAVSYIDRFLSAMSVLRAKLQLVGTAAMFIAAKYEEIYPPDVKDFVYITDDTYTKEQILRMEVLILRVLSFDLSTPTVFNFVSDYTSHYSTPDNVKYLTMYLCELTLLEGDPYLGFLPSEVAAAALCVARALLQPEEEILPPKLQRVLDVHLSDIMHVVSAIEKTFCNAENSTYHATKDKFKAEKFLRISDTPSPSKCSSILSRELSTDKSA